MITEFLGELSLKSAFNAFKVFKVSFMCFMEIEPTVLFIITILSQRKFVIVYTIS